MVLFGYFAFQETSSVQKKNYVPDLPPTEWNEAGHPAQLAIHSKKK